LLEKDCEVDQIPLSSVEENVISRGIIRLNSKTSGAQGKQMQRMRILLGGAILQSLLELLQITSYRELDQVNEMLSLSIKGLTRRS